MVMERMFPDATSDPKDWRFSPSASVSSTAGDGSISTTANIGEGAIMPRSQLLKAKLQQMRERRLKDMRAKPPISDYIKTKMAAFSTTTDAPRQEQEQKTKIPTDAPEERQEVSSQRTNEVTRDKMSGTKTTREWPSDEKMPPENPEDVIAELEGMLKDTSERSQGQVEGVPSRVEQDSKVQVEEVSEEAEPSEDVTEEEEGTTEEERTEEVSETDITERIAHIEPKEEDNGSHPGTAGEANNQSNHGSGDAGERNLGSESRHESDSPRACAQKGSERHRRASSAREHRDRSSRRGSHHRQRGSASRHHRSSAARRSSRRHSSRQHRSSRRIHDEEEMIQNSSLNNHSSMKYIPTLPRIKQRDSNIHGSMFLQQQDDYQTWSRSNCHNKANAAMDNRQLSRDIHTAQPQLQQAFDSIQAGNLQTSDLWPQGSQDPSDVSAVAAAAKAAEAAARAATAAGKALMSLKKSKANQENPNLAVAMAAAASAASAAATAAASVAASLSSAQQAPIQQASVVETNGDAASRNALYDANAQASILDSVCD